MSKNKRTGIDKNDAMMEHTPRAHLVFACVLVAIISFSAFFPALDNGFISMDDHVYITSNDMVKTGLTFESVKWAFTDTSSTGNWHPVTWLFHLVDYELFADNASGHHLTSLLLHSLVSVAVFLVLFLYTRMFWLSLVATLLFAVHPLRVESVAWASEKKDLASALFWFLSMLAYYRYTRSTTLGRYALVFVLMLIGLMCKPMLVTLPVILLIVDYWPLGRFSHIGARKIFLEKLPLVILSVVFAAIAITSQKAGSALTDYDMLPISSRLSNAVVSYFSYMASIFFPHDLAPFYPYPKEGIVVWLVASCTAVLAGLSAFAVYARKRAPFVFAGWYWYVITLLPVIGLVQIGEQASADRYTYIPSLGITVAAVWGVYFAAGRLPAFFRHFVLPAISIALVAVLFINTFAYTSLWKDTMTLFTHTADVTRENDVAHFNLGNAYMEKGDHLEAEKHFKLAVKYNPYNTRARSNLGGILLANDDMEAARFHLERTLEYDPHDYVALYYLAQIAMNSDNFSAAKDYLERCLEARPGFFHAYVEYAIVLYATGDYEKSMDYIEKAEDAGLEVVPDFKDAVMSRIKEERN